MSWTPPTQNEDGGPLLDLAGYRLYGGTSASNLTVLQDLMNPGLTRHVVTDLAPGTYYVAIAALNRSGTESRRSSVISKTIGAQAALPVNCTVSSGPRGPQEHGAPAPPPLPVSHRDANPQHRHPGGEWRHGVPGADRDAQRIAELHGCDARTSRNARTRTSRNARAARSAPQRVRSDGTCEPSVLHGG